MPLLLSLLLHKRLYLFIISLIFLIISMFGPVGVKVSHIAGSLDLLHAYDILINHPNPFRLPDTTIRIIIFLIGLIFLILLPTIKTNNNFSFKKINHYLLILSFIFYASFLNTDNVYNYAAILITLASIFYYIYSCDQTLNRNEKFYISSFVIIFLIPFIHNSLISSGNFFITRAGDNGLWKEIIYGEKATFPEIDNYIRFLFAIPVYLLFKNINYNKNLLIISINIFAIIIGLTLITFYFTTINHRVVGYTSTASILGNIASLFSILSLLSIKYFHDNMEKFKFIPIAGFVLSFMAWILTGSRGPLIAIFVILIFLIFNKHIRNKYLSFSFKNYIIFFLLIGIFFQSSLFMKNSNVFERIMSSYSSTYNYIYEDSPHYWKHKDSIAPRLNIWKGSLNIISDNIVAGVGLNNYNNALQNQILNKHISPIRKSISNPTAGLNHAHNQYLDIFAKTGIIGFLSLLYFIIMNIYFFSNKLLKNIKNILALFGLVTIITYSSHMVYHTILSHHQSVLFFTYSLAILAGFSFSYDKEKAR